MPRLAHDPSLPVDRAERRRELARRRKMRQRSREQGDPVADIARDLATRLDSEQRRRLAELLLAA